MLRITCFGLLIVALVAGGCSKKKEKADQLQDQMRNMEQPVTDTMASDSMASEAMSESTLVGNALAVPEEETPAHTMPQRPESSGFTVQVASCEDANYAQYLVDLFKKRGYEPFVTTYVKDDAVYYRVRIGVFESLSEAQSLVDDLKDKYSITAWIDRN